MALSVVFALVGGSRRVRLRRSVRIPRPRDVLLLRLDLLGDLVFSLPAAAAIKRAFPGVRVTLVALPYTAPLALASPHIDEVIVLDTNALRSAGTLFQVDTVRAVRDAVQRLRARRFDVAISVWGLTASALAALTRARVRAGYAGEAYAGALDLVVPGGRGRRGRPRRRHETDAVMDLLAGMWAELDDASRSLDLHVDPAARVRVIELLREAGLDGDRPLAAFHAGSRHGTFKRWPTAYYTELARRLIADGFDVIVVGSRAESDLATEIMRGSGATSLVGRTDVLEFVALLEQVHILVSGDSGPLHVAAALGTPVVAIYGPTDPRVNGPRPNGPAVVLRRDLPCSPCYRLDSRPECPLGDPICMRLVTPERVYSATRQVVPDLFRSAQPAPCGTAH